MRHWINSELGAVNVMTIPVDQGIVDEFAQLANAPLDRTGFVCVKPPWNSDVRWISAANEETFQIFQSAFDRLNIAEVMAPYLDIEREVRLFAGFLIVRTECTEPSFHVDWKDSNNEGFNINIPITDNTEGFGIIYKKVNGRIGEYSYKRGEGLILGEHFTHSTAPGQSEQPVVLLSFAFGTHKMEHWDKLHQTIGYQTLLVRCPDGQFSRNENCPGLVTTSD